MTTFFLYCMVDYVNPCKHGESEAAWQVTAGAGLFFNFAYLHVRITKKLTVIVLVLNVVWLSLARAMHLFHRIVSGAVTTSLPGVLFAFFSKLLLRNDRGETYCIREQIWYKLIFSKLICFCTLWGLVDNNTTVCEEKEKSHEKPLLISPTSQDQANRIKVTSYVGHKKTVFL